MSDYPEIYQEYLKTIGSRIRIQRKKINLSQEDLAYEAQLDRTYIGSIERGERNISIINLIRIAVVLKISLSELLTDIK